MIGNISGAAGKPIYFLIIKADADSSPILVKALSKGLSDFQCVSIFPSGMYSKNDSLVILLTDTEKIDTIARHQQIMLYKDKKLSTGHSKL